MRHTYKVLIADDEYWIREKLKIILDWEDYSFFLLEPAKDGEEVLKKMEEECPDILIIDINMPFLNGIEVLKIVRDKYPDVVSIVLSGYSDFEYVREGLLVGAINYLLKPVAKIDLINTLTTALDKINETRMQAKKKEYERVELLRAASFLKDREYSLFITKDPGTAVEDELLSNLEIQPMEIQSASHILMLVKINNLSRVADVFQYDMNLLSYTIKKRIEESLKDMEAVVFNNIYMSNEFIIISNRKKETINSHAEKLMNGLSNFTEHTVSVVVGKEFFGEENLRRAYLDAKTALDCREFSKTNQILLVENSHLVYGDHDISPETENRMIYYLNNNNGKGLKRLIFDGTGIRKCEEEKWLVAHVKNTVNQIVRILNRHSKKEKSTLERLEFENTIDSLSGLIEDLDLEETCNILEQLIEDSVEEKSIAVENESIKETVKSIARYIDEFYFEELSLTILSHRFHVESSYLSKMFKKEIGDNLMLYITRSRIEKAKELIEKQESSITEIAFLVGYDDYSYFNKVFKKMTGMSPRDYKNTQNSPC